MFNIFKKDSDEQKLKKQIYERALAMAEDSYKKELMFRSLQASDLHYAIIEDLMKAAKLTGEVIITLKDGATVKIVNKEPDYRADLNKLDSETLY